MQKKIKNKSNYFLQIILFLSQGFKYFQPWLRGKEELLLTVVNEDLVGERERFITFMGYNSGLFICSLVLHGRLAQMTRFLMHHIIISNCRNDPLLLRLCRPVLQGWRSPGFVVSRASSYTSTSSCNSSDVSPSSSSPSLDSRSSSPLPGEPPGPRDPGSAQSHAHTKAKPQTSR